MSTNINTKNEKVERLIAQFAELIEEAKEQGPAGLHMCIVVQIARLYKTQLDSVLATAKLTGQW